MGSDSESSSCCQIQDNSAKSERFVCHYSDCLSVFNRQWKLDRHICSHTKERPFKCDYPNCSKDYTNKYHLQRHITVSHRKVNLEPVHISCPYPGCFRQYQNKYSLKKHFKSHTNVTEYKCSKCDLNFKKRRQLTYHVRTHEHLETVESTNPINAVSDGKDLSCLKKKNKVYICEYDECEEKFSAWSSLRKHFKLKHSRCYICDFCNRSYINKNTLTKHIFRHLGIKNPEVYFCPYKDCFRYYHYKRNLMHHIRTTHEGKQFKCPEENCTSVFKSENRLKDHLMRHKTGQLHIKPKTPKKDRKSRKDKGLRRKSIFSYLSGLNLPFAIDKRLAQHTVTPEVEEDIAVMLINLKDKITVDK